MVLACLEDRGSEAVSPAAVMHSLLPVVKNGQDVVVRLGNASNSQAGVWLLPHSCQEMFRPLLFVVSGEDPTSISAATSLPWRRNELR
jgi:hypothetical protein